MTSRSEALATVGGWLEQAQPRPARAAACRPLKVDQTLAIRPAESTAVRCCAGSLLVTQEGDPEDHVLFAGEVFNAARRGLVVAWALSDAEVSVHGAR